MAAVGGLLTISCGRDSMSSVASPARSNSEKNAPPVVTLVEIAQTTIRADEPIMARVETKDPDGDPITVQYRWLINDRVVDGKTEATFLPEQAKRGDTIVVEATPHDKRKIGAPMRSRPVTVGNTPPIVRALSLEPTEAKPGDTLSVSLDVWDPDQDDVQYMVKWWRNEHVVAEGEMLNQFIVQDWNRGDVAMVSIVTRDKEGRGRETFSEGRVLFNAPPQFTSTPAIAVKDGQFEYRAQAADAEGDPLSFKLESAPLGMTINEQTGQVRWPVPNDAAGAYPVRLVVVDDHGGRTFQEFILSVPHRKVS